MSRLIKSHAAARKAKEHAAQLDFSQNLRDPSVWRAAADLAWLGLGSELTCIAHDPVQSLLAVGTVGGRILVLGQGPARCDWVVTRAPSIKHLAFRQGSSFLCAIDNHDTLHVYDLSRLKNGVPVCDTTISLRSRVMAVETSPMLAHIFLGGQDGSVDLFDLDSCKLAMDSRIPNCGLAADEVLRRSGVANAPPRNYIPSCTDLKIHPLDINLLLIGHENSVTLYNLSQKKVERSYDFILPPGAPGGYVGSQEELFMERRLRVSCLAWRPDGQMFAVGHDDGCISFCAVNEEYPIAVRTIEREDVSKATEEDLFGWQGRTAPVREPIFRLSWSTFAEEGVFDRIRVGVMGNSPDPSTSAPASPSLEVTPGSTYLAILGGLVAGDPTGVHVFEYPRFEPPPRNATGGQNREAFKKSLEVQHHHVYPSSAPVDDFVVLPRESPYYGGAYDPVGIIMVTPLSSSVVQLPDPHAKKGLDAYTFPPSSRRPPTPLGLPSPMMWAGNDSCVIAHVHNLSKPAYGRVTRDADRFDRSNAVLKLRGGKAYPRPRNTQNGPRLDVSPRILVTAHANLKIRFWDVSDHLLAVPQQPQPRYRNTTQPEVQDAARKQLESDFPKPLHHLTWDIANLLQNRGCRALRAAHALAMGNFPVEITDLSFAPEMLEVAVTLSTGECVVARLESLVSEADEDALYANVGAALRELSLDAPAFDDSERVIDLSDITRPFSNFDGFAPVVGVNAVPRFGSSRLSLSDVGFLAASFDDRLLIVSLRGSGELLYDSSESKATDKRSKRSRITSLAWGIATTMDGDEGVRLVATQEDGQIRVHQVAQVAEEWLVPEKVGMVSDKDLAGVISSFVLSKDGAVNRPTIMGLQHVTRMQSSFTAVHEHGFAQSYGAYVTPRGFAVTLNVDGPSLFDGEAPFDFRDATIITRAASSAIVTRSGKDNKVRVFSLPTLEQLTRLDIDLPPSTLSFASDGDFVAYTAPLVISLGTLFDWSKGACPPEVEMHDAGVWVPSHPGLSATRFFGWSGSISGAKLDEILGGPKRAPPKDRGERRPAVAMPRQRPPRDDGRLERIQRDQDDLGKTIGHTNEALEERGDRLRDLQEGLADIGQEASKFAQNARRLAAQQSAKSSFKNSVSSLWK